MLHEDEVTTTRNWRNVGVASGKMWGGGKMWGWVWESSARGKDYRGRE